MIHKISLTQSCKLFTIFHNVPIKDNYDLNVDSSVSNLPVLILSEKKLTKHKPQPTCVHEWAFHTCSDERDSYNVTENLPVSSC